MGQELQHYTVVITTETPLFIGSGKAIGKKEYIFSPGERLVYIPDMTKMFCFFQQRDLLNDYEAYLLRSDKDFSLWLKDHKIEKREYLPWTAYTIHRGNTFLNKNKISTFVKDAYGCPYVPGSSLKGAFRTALLTAAILQNPIAYQEIKQAVEKKTLDQEAEMLETQTFNLLHCIEETSNAVNDVMRGLRVGDSDPLSTKDLTLCQKIDVSLDGSKRKLPILRECIRPDTKIRFPLTIDPVLFPYTVELLLRALDQQIEGYYRYFRSKFHPREKALEKKLYLGGGCGYATKTVTYPLLGESGVKRVSEIIDTTLDKCTKQKHGHRKDVQKGASPHTLKCTQYQGKLYEMGRCNITID